MTPTINVNLKHCDTPHLCRANGGDHVSVCAAAPIPIPCPIPRSVTFEVVLGECDKACQHGRERAQPTNGHWRECAAHPLRVTFSVSGKTWEELEVGEIDTVPSSRHLQATTPADVETRFRDAAAAATVCRERWALVKALVLGQRANEYTGWCGSSLRAFSETFQQRDAVFAALVDMARAEDAHGDALIAFVSATNFIGMERQASGGYRLPPDARATTAPSRHLLAAYIERLVAQVGAL